MKALVRNWWVVLLRGLLAILFGVLAVTWPGATLAVIVWLFGAYAFVYGVSALIFTFSPLNTQRWASILQAVVGIGIGILTLRQPAITALALYTYVAFWAVFTGIAEIVLAIDLRKEIEHEGFLILAGVLSVVFGVFLFVLPAAGALALVGVIATYAMVLGIFYCALAFRLRRFGKDHPVLMDMAHMH